MVTVTDSNLGGKGGGVCSFLIVSLSQRTLTMFAGVVALGCQHLAMLALVMECYNSYKHRVFNQGIIDIQEWKLDQFFFVC